MFLCSAELSTLVATGRNPNTERLGLELTGVELTDRGYIKVNERLQPTAPGVWAIGEVAGSPQFTHISIDIIVRYAWTVNPKGSKVVAKWEQAFSTNNRKTWETNWYNEFIHDDNCTPTP
jgi:hypothetical protein